MSNYKIIAFEGLDCSFKETNYKSFLYRLRNTYRKPNYSIHAASFPRYGNWSAKPCEKWLNGTFDRHELSKHPKAICSLYSIDRLDYWYGANGGGRRRIELLNDDTKTRYFVFDRYNMSNTIYNPIYPNEVNIEDFTFDKDNYGIPNPDVIVWMRMNNFNILSNLLANKQGKDQNELDMGFIKSRWERSEEIIKSDIFDSLGIELIVVDCLTDSGSIRSREELHDFIWDSVENITH